MQINFLLGPGWTENPHIDYKTIDFQYLNVKSIKIPFWHSIVYNSLRTYWLFVSYEIKLRKNYRNYRQMQNLT